jgi:hypothetical protein
MKPLVLTLDVYFRFWSAEENPIIEVMDLPDVADAYRPLCKSYIILHISHIVHNSLNFPVLKFLLFRMVKLAVLILLVIFLITTAILGIVCPSSLTSHHHQAKDDSKNGRAFAEGPNVDNNKHPAMVDAIQNNPCMPEGQHDDLANSDSWRRCADY